MPIPEHILRVERPKNTIVKAYGTYMDHYAVIERIGCKRVNGGNHPVNGKVIGHIVDGKYVKKEPDPVIPVSISTSIDLKTWANAVLCSKIFEPVILELEEVYCHADAIRIACMVILSVCNPGIKYCEMQDAYQESFLSEIYPNVPMSKNSISTFLNDLGKNCSRIFKFMQNRSARIGMDDRILIDGTLKTNDSTVNSFSNFSRKAKLKGRKDVSIIFSFNLENNEPVCSQCFPGNMLDVTSYNQFITDNGIHQGILVGDKGFPSSSIEAVLKKHPDLHYLNPIKRNSKYVETHQLLEFEGVLSGYPTVTYKKEKVQGRKKWLYAFRDSEEAALEEKEWLANRQKEKDFTMEAYEKKKKSFGMIVLESDLDLDVLEIYRMYLCRWEIELVMRFYKSALEFQEVRVHDDYSVIAAEFIDFLATLLTFKILNLFDQKGLLETQTYKKVMKKLSGVKKVKMTSEWSFTKMNPNVEELLKVLELVDSEVKQQKKRGRPRIHPLPDPNQPKRKRGRPRKNPV